ncbi:uncharacterized protein LOC125073891 [Vanessa atalanta]|uniref:uncharacterized protein LOC125073891 n=1 Tax=Vanessa atalanta TaxID=42275 RepID=UPI001FCD2D81|nr:uncharacterized protein LOC125073891 [Vanessa atalanta]
MFPSKNMDYVEDIQNLLLKPRMMDGDSIFNYGQSPFQSGMVNRSSSSADSTSPETYFENALNIRQTADHFHCMRTRSNTPKHVYETPKLSYESPTPINCRYGSFTNIFDPTFDTSTQNLDSPASIYEPFISTYESPTNSRQIFDTPLQMRRQHPIVGRKILGRNSQPKLECKAEQEMDIWQTDTLGQTPPDAQKSYELFPSDKGFQFSSSSKPTNLSPGYNRSIKNMSPITNSSPTYTPRMPISPRSPTAQSNFTTPFNPSNVACSLSNEGQKMCTFCRKNGETPIVYMTHCVKEKLGNIYVVTCPILRSHVCSICGSSGDNAHTITYCPVLRRTNDGKPLKSTTITLKNTRIKSNGRRRY